MREIAEKPDMRSQQGEAPWVDAWVRWERNSFDVYEGGERDQDEVTYDDGSDSANREPTDLYCYHYKLKDQESGDDKSISISLRGFDPDSEAIWNSTGLTVWRSSHYLCEYLLQHSEMLKGNCRILELGSGLGRCGLLAHQLSDENGRTYLTDGDTDTLSQLRDNVRNNVLNFDESLSCHQLLWGESTATTFLRDHCSQDGEEKQFDVIFGSDLVYVPRVIEPLFETVQILINQGGVFVMAHCERREGNEVEVEMVLNDARKSGFRYDLVEEADDIFVYEFRLV